MQHIFVRAPSICGFLSVTTDGISVCFVFSVSIFGLSRLGVCLRGRGYMLGEAWSMVSFLKGGEWWVSLFGAGFGLSVRTVLKGCFYGELQYMW